MRISLLRRLGPALSISQVLDYTWLVRIVCLPAEEMIREKTAPLTREKRNKRRKKAATPMHNKLCPPRPRSLTDTLVSGTTILLLMMHHFPLEPSLPLCYPRLLHRGRTRHTSPHAGTRHKSAPPCRIHVNHLVWAKGPVRESCPRVASEKLN